MRFGSHLVSCPLSSRWDIRRSSCGSRTAHTRPSDPTAAVYLTILGVLFDSDGHVDDLQLQLRVGIPVVWLVVLWIVTAGSATMRGYQRLWHPFVLLVRHWPRGVG